MKKLRIGWNLKQALKNLFRNKLMTLVSLVSIIVNLMIVSVFLVILMNVNSMMVEVEDNVEIVVYLEKEITREANEEIQEKIRGLDSVDSVDFISKEDGLDNLIEGLGEDGLAFKSLKEDNPLNDTLVVRAVDPKDTSDIAEYIKEQANVYKVDYGEEIINILFTITENVRNVGLVLIVALSVTALLLISNTIKMTIEFRKEEVKVMKLVGSTNLFIRLPFVIEGVILSLLGAVIPVIMMYFIYSDVTNQYNNSLAVNFANLLPLSSVMLLVIVVLFGLSLFIGIVGSLISIRKYLNI